MRSVMHSTCRVGNVSSPATGDLLSAASILLGVVTFIYGTALPNLARAKGLRLAGRDPVDAESDLAEARSARQRAMLIVGSAAAVGAVFAPETVSLLWHLLSDLADRSISVHYDPLAVSLVVVNLACFAIAAHAGATAAGLSRAVASLSGRP